MHFAAGICSPKIKIKNTSVIQDVTLTILLPVGRNRSSIRVVGKYLSSDGKKSKVEAATRAIIIGADPASESTSTQLPLLLSLAQRIIK